MHDPEGTERHVNLMDPDGRRASIYVNGGSADPAVTEDDLAAFTAGADYVWVNLASYSRRALPGLAARGTPVWADVHDWDGQNDFHREFVDAARCLFLSDEALEDPVGFAAHLVQGREVVVVTHGRGVPPPCCPATTPCSSRHWRSRPSTPTAQETPSAPGSPTGAAAAGAGHGRWQPAPRWQRAASRARTLRTPR